MKSVAPIAKKMFFQKEILPPSSVDSAIEGHFISTEKLNICVARADCLTIYDIICFDGDVDNSEMRVLYQHRLNGDVRSVQRLKNPAGSGVDYLLLAFSDAKLSVLQYSEQEARFFTISMHCFEQDKFRSTKEMDTSLSFPPDLRVEPGNRCAAVRFYRDNIAILPVKEEVATGTGVMPFTPSFVFRSLDFGATVKNIIDFAFLEGYFEPTLAILYETIPATTSLPSFSNIPRRMAGPQATLAMSPNGKLRPSAREIIRCSQARI